LSPTYLQDVDQGGGFAYTSGNTSALPIEILSRFSMEVQWDSTNCEWSLQMDSDGDPVTSMFWVVFFMDAVDTTGTFSNHDFTLEFSLQSSEGAAEDALGMFPRTGIVENDYARWDLWMRLRADADGSIHAKVWEDGDPEPGSWTLEDLAGMDPSATFTLLGHFIAPDSDGVAFTLFEEDSFEITEGCIESGSECTIYDAENNIVGTIDNDGVITAEELDLSCPVSLVITLDEEPYLLPTEPLRVQDVWFDYLHATRGTHWELSDQEIEVLSPISDETLVRVAFVVQQDEA
jgi:hypothetical protein